MFKRLKNIRVSLRQLTLHEAAHHSYKFGHTSYFMFVFLEGHSVYAMIGGGLFLLSAADIFFHIE